jgi:hypothetical protein
MPDAQRAQYLAPFLDTQRQFIEHNGCAFTDISARDRLDIMHSLYEKYIDHQLFRDYFPLMTPEEKVADAGKYFLGDVDIDILPNPSRIGVVYAAYKILKENRRIYLEARGVGADMLVAALADSDRVTSEHRFTLREKPVAPVGCRAGDEKTGNDWLRALPLPGLPN